MRPIAMFGMLKWLVFIVLAFFGFSTYLDFLQEDDKSRWFIGFCIFVVLASPLGISVLYQWYRYIKNPNA